MFHVAERQIQVIRSYSWAAREGFGKFAGRAVNDFVAAKSFAARFGWRCVWIFTIRVRG
jgi:hypothetical protein